MAPLQKRAFLSLVLGSILAITLIISTLAQSLGILIVTGK